MRVRGGHKFLGEKQRRKEKGKEKKKKRKEERRKERMKEGKNEKGKRGWPAGPRRRRPELAGDGRPRPKREGS